MIELFPEGFEEREDAHGLELAAYTDAGGEERVWHVFGGVRVDDVEGGWEQRWKRFHQPVRIGPLWIGPPWESPPTGSTGVTIDPGRAFGTGSHATTRLCLELLMTLPRGSLLDVGCGSGVVAIAGAKLGFAPVKAVDSDPEAIDATRRNASANGVDLDLAVVDAVAMDTPSADVAVANIALDIVERVVPQLDARCVVTSGYLASERPVVAGFDHADRCEADGWAADVFKRQDVGRG
jgi:ribosomal protein L11 methyltransferase